MEFNAAVSSELQQVVCRMLAKDPAQRYATPDRAAQALQPFLASGDGAPGHHEASPRMRAFLTWLETEDGGESSGPAGTRESGKKHHPKKHKHKPHQAEAPAPAGPSIPVPSLPVFDAELVPPAHKEEARRWKLLHLTRRDMVLMGLGAGGVGLAIFAGWLLAKLYNP